MENLKIKIDFGGFYESNHSGLIDDMTENTDADWETIDYQKLHNLYSENYIDFINSEMGIDCKYILLDSPREYNFSTDKIIVEISKKDSLKILSYVNKYYKKQLIKSIKDKTTKIDGFSPFYTYKDILKKENIDLLIQFCFDVLIWESKEHEELNISNFRDYFYDNNLIDLIYEVKFLEYKKKA